MNDWIECVDISFVFGKGACIYNDTNGHTYIVHNLLLSTFTSL